MNTILFYEKPGCVANSRQKNLLQDAGYEVDARNLLTEPWTAERLLSFFSGMPVPDWFNRNAPQVKEGELIPELLTAEEAIALMLQDPLLIRRPLMQIGEHYLVGCDSGKLNQVLALSWSESEEAGMERCPRYVGQSCSDTER